MESSNELFSLGNMGDKLLYEGEYHKAEEIYTKLYEKIISSNKIDQYIMSKICLGMMIAKIKLGKRQEAYDIITQDIGSITENNWYGIVMTGLRKGMISKRDDLIHGIVYAFFSALEKEPIEKRANSVNLVMGEICDESMKEFPDIFEITINNWKILIAHEIYGKWSEVPKRYIEEIQEREKKYGKTLKISKPDFPRLSKWERPSNAITIFKRDGSVCTEKIH